MSTRVDWRTDASTPPSGRARRAARPEDVRRAFYVLRDAGFDNISLDLIYGIPGQSAADLERDLAEALALEPEHVSAYELEAKPGTRFTHATGGARAPGRVDGDLLRAGRRDADGRGLPLVRDGELLPRGDGRGRDLRARHNLGYWLGRDYLGLGVGAVSTIDGRRWRNAPRCARYLAALGAGERPPREVEELAARRSRRASGDARPAPRRAAAARRARASARRGELARLVGSGSPSAGAGRSRSPSAAASSATA